VVCRKVRSEKEVRRRLESLKGKVGEENSFAFMFACCGRGEDHYRGQQFVMELKYHMVIARTLEYMDVPHSL
jgi:hypothetical protein